jgi:hypothetical protein
MSAADMTDMMYSTATLRSDYPLTDIDADELVHEDEKPPEDHDDQPQTKLFGDMTKAPAPTQKSMREEEPHHATHGPGAEDDQPAQQDWQPSKTTCDITQPATIPAAVARLVPNPVGYNVNVPPSYLTTQVQNSHSRPTT